MKSSIDALKVRWILHGEHNKQKFHHSRGRNKKEQVDRYIVADGSGPAAERKRRIKAVTGEEPKNGSFEKKLKKLSSLKIPLSSLGFTSLHFLFLLVFILNFSKHD